MRLIVLILLLFALPALADTLTVSVDRDNGVTQTTEPLTLSPANIGALQAGDVATYVIAPYGATYKADYYCSVTDCKTSFQMVFDAIKASGKGGEISLREGTYLFASGVDASDADTVKVKGVGGVGMWAGGGTIFKRTANVTMFNYSSATKNPRACQVEGIHFVDQSAGYTAPVLKYHNAHNMAQIGNYFESIPQAIYADRAWDFWTSKNNFRNCGTGATASTACVVAADGNYDQVSGWKVEGNRWESRPGTSFLSDSSGTGGVNNNISFVDNKFEGVNGGQSYPAIAGAMNYSRLIGNYVYGSDTGYSPIDINGDDNTVIANHVQSHKEPAIKVNGWYNNVQSNQFRSAAANLSGHIQIVGGATGNRVANNIKYDPSYPSIPMILDGGTGTVAYRNTGAENNAIANLSDWPASVNATELGYLDGVTSAIQTQLNGKPTATLVTSVGSPGSDSNVPSEAAVRAAITASSSGAPADAAYVTIGANTGLSGERALVGTTNQITVTDGGANGNVTLSTPQNLNTSAAVTFGTATLGGTGGGILLNANGAGVTNNHGIQFNPTISTNAIKSVIRSQAGIVPTANISQFTGFSLNPRLKDNNGTSYNITGNFIGVDIEPGADAYTAGTTLYNGSVANSIGLQVNDFINNNSSNPTITVQYGIKVANQTKGATNYAIHSGTGKVYHGDDVQAKTFTGTIPSATTYGATTTIDLSLGDSPSVTLAGNTTLAFSNPKAGQWHRLNIAQPSSGGTYNYTVTWPSTGLVCTWRNTTSNSAPTLLTGANKVDTIIIHTLSTTSAECWTGGNK